MVYEKTVLVNNKTGEIVILQDKPMHDVDPTPYLEAQVDYYVSALKKMKEENK